jgi:hypothetical protein
MYLVVIATLSCVIFYYLNFGIKMKNLVSPIISDICLMSLHPLLKKKDFVNTLVLLSSWHLSSSLGLFKLPLGVSYPILLDRIDQMALFLEVFI